MTGTHGPYNAFLDLRQIPVAHANLGPLAGLRLAVKDIYDVAGYRTGCGNSRKFAEGIAATSTAPAVQTILDAGARFVGKTQTDELAFALFGQNAHFPFPVNPAAPDRVTGGSSSGSASAVAGGLADIATGSDTGGSIRAPASFCGLIGLRTTHGRIALDGTMKLAPSFDTFGWFADEMVAGPALAEYARMKALAGAVFGTPATSTTRFSSSPDELYWCFRRLQAREAWGVHGEWITSGERDLGPGVEERFGFGRAVDDRTAQAENVRRLTFRGELSALLGKDGFLVLPTVPGPAPYVDSTPEQFQAYRERALHLLCLAGLSGFPQITLPIGSVAGAPFGLSLLGPSGSDIALIRLGRKLLDAAQKA
ncbi:MULTISPECIES: amidase family protein [unclassified Mesorhizobium]|uniref:amidase family protein n=1 Tax=unclassified Mesorhizobium TaxID=325217 RepID=UPI000BAE733A|nr:MULTISPECIES: amidase family protein [unclassified Mesorhizobium]PBC21653.1 amidase [Mesorhizobium sp. WSM4311]TRD01743.1 amidase [Mesorhizobium sp. WSM4305]